jgi:hypothetical protein
MDGTFKKSEKLICVLSGILTEEKGLSMDKKISHD